MGSPGGSHVSNYVRGGFGRAGSVAGDRQLNGVAPNITLACELWGHMHHDNGSCECLSSDRTGAYLHELALATSSRYLVSDSGEMPHAVSSGLSGVSGDRDAEYSGYDGPANSVAMRLCSVPYVYHRSK